MYLSDKLNNVPRKVHDHEELEVLLESFAKQVEEIVNEAENIQVSSGHSSLLSLSPTACFCTIWRSSAALRGLISLSPAFCRVLLLTLHPQSNVQSTQEIVELILDANRNALLALDLKISILTMGIGIGTLVVGVFGMNVSRQIRLLFASHVR